ncbi:MAG: translation initiation factor IF-2 [Oscillospiraceae bacterium]|nr:translation initiation factor IF-2 [Oscillospiraceae bacterium]
MFLKYRVNEVAKDLGVSSKEVIEVLRGVLGVERKSMTALNEDELDVIFEYYTQKFSVKSFDSYFAGRLLNQNVQISTEKDIDKILKIYREKVKKPKLPEKIKQEKTESVVISEEIEPSQQKIVDLRAKNENVNIDKYNEKYDKIAAETTPKNRFKETIKKQKFTQRLQKNKKSKKRETESERLARIAKERKNRPITVLIPEEITVGDLSLRLKARSSEVIKKLVSLGVMSAVNDVIDFDTAASVAFEFHAKVEKEISHTIEELIIDDSEDSEKDLSTRPPVVVVMGHVDHGKTSLLDKIRSASVASTEHGGITQHIGAYKTKIKNRSITFLDTPGHEAFTSMRARGAQATDLAVLVVAADDGVMPQTVEAINHAKDAGVSIVVALNKIDKPGANIEKIKQQLTEHNVVCEEWGGDVPFIAVSAKNGTGIEDLLEMIILTSDLKELKANPNRRALGMVIEARLDKNKGAIATILVTNGTLNLGDIIVAGTSVGRIRSMVDDKGKSVKKALPSDPVEITGLSSPPCGGDLFNSVSDEKLARRLVDQRHFLRENERLSSVTKVSLDNLFDQMQEKDAKIVKIILKADVNGSAEAVKQSLEKISVEDIGVKVIHSAVGAINESDVMLASASEAIVVGFNVRPGGAAEENARLSHVDVRLYRIIYDCVNEITEAIKGMLAPKFREVILGKAECRKVFNVSKVGTVAGCYVLEGKIARSASVRLIRDGVVITEDKIVSLKKYKDDTKEVLQNYECGIILEHFNDFKPGDVFEAFNLLILKGAGKSD